MSTEQDTKTPVVEDTAEKSQAPVTAPPVETKVTETPTHAKPTPAKAQNIPVSNKPQSMHPTDARISGDVENAIHVLMDLDRTTPPQVAVAQKNFVTGIVRGLTAGSVEDSVIFLGNLLAIINENSTDGKCFSPLYLFREWHRINVQHELLLEYEQMLSILVDTSNPATRKTAVKSISFRTYFTAIKTPYRERVIEVMQNFYHLD